MSPERLQELYAYAWETFYRDEPQNYKMFKLFKKVVEREKGGRDLPRPGGGIWSVRRFGREGTEGSAGEANKS